MPTKPATIIDLLRTKKTIQDIDEVFWGFIDKSDVPSWMMSATKWKAVTMTGPSSYGLSDHVLTIAVCPDYASVGTDDDTLRVALCSQNLAQKWADKLYSILPTPKMLRAIEAAVPTSHRIDFLDVKTGPDKIGNIATVDALVSSNNMANKAFAARGMTAGIDPAIGYAKSFCVRPGLDGSSCLIAGGWCPQAGNKGCSAMPNHGNAAWDDKVQPPATVHGWFYADDSQKITLVARTCTLNGKFGADLVNDVFKSTDSSLVQLVADTDTAFSPRFPNTGAKSGLEEGDYSEGFNYFDPTAYFPLADLVSMAGLTDLLGGVTEPGRSVEVTPISPSELSVVKPLDTTSPVGAIVSWKGALAIALIIGGIAYVLR